MSDGIVKILPEEARSRADELGRLAGEVENVLTDVKTRMRDINDENTGTYHGAKKPSELRAELDSFSDMFANFYEQIRLYRADIYKTVQTMENE